MIRWFKVPFELHAKYGWYTQWTATINSPHKFSAWRLLAQNSIEIHSVVQHANWMEPSFYRRVTLFLQLCSPSSVTGHQSDDQRNGFPLRHLPFAIQWESNLFTRDSSDRNVTMINDVVSRSNMCGTLALLPHMFRHRDKFQGSLWSYSTCYNVF